MKISLYIFLVRLPIDSVPEDAAHPEVIYRVKPDVIIETGVAHGGSLIFASLCKAIGKGRIIELILKLPHIIASY